MSSTYRLTKKPPSRGRRQADDSEYTDDSNEYGPAVDSPGSSQQPEDRSQTLSPRHTSGSTFGYHVFVPDEQKQAKLKQVAEAEESAFAERRRIRLAQLRSETRQLGEGVRSVSYEEARERQARKNQRAKHHLQMKREERAEAERERQDNKLKQMKLEARRKSEALETRRKEEMRAARLKRFASNEHS